MRLLIPSFYLSFCASRKNLANFYTPVIPLKELVIRASILLIHRNHPHTRQQGQRRGFDNGGQSRGSSSPHTLDPFLSDTAFHVKVVNLQCTACNAAQQAGRAYFDAKPFYLVIMVIVVIIWYSTRVNTSYVRVAILPLQDPVRCSHCPLPGNLIDGPSYRRFCLLHMPECHSSITAKLYGTTINTLFPPSSQPVDVVRDQPLTPSDHRSTICSVSYLPNQAYIARSHHPRNGLNTTGNGAPIDSLISTCLMYTGHMLSVCVWVPSPRALSLPWRVYINYH